ncbi:MAG: PAS-domain containing protein [Alphaproteobacteria bacterium]|nr:PAS-domain containing protein [Alphaproteobacteria bacterium]
MGIAFVALGAGGLMVGGLIGFAANYLLERIKQSPSVPFLPKGKHNPFGYVIWDINEKKAQVINLHTLLHIITPIRSLEQLASYFSGADQSHFLQACQDCIVKQHNFSMTLQTSIQDQNRFVDCYAHLDFTDIGKPHQITFYFWEVTPIIVQDQELQRHHTTLQQQAEHYLMLANAAPFPMWQRNENLDITFCNSSYCQAVDYHIGGTSEEKQAIPELCRTGRHLGQKALANKKTTSENHHVIIEGERRLFSIMEVPSSDFSSLNGYAIDITAQEVLTNDINSHIKAQSDFFESMTSAVALFSSDTRIQFYNHAFFALWGLDEQWLATHPTYSEFLSKLRDERKLPEQANFLIFKESQLKLFGELTSPHNEFYYLPNGNTLRVVAIPYAMGGLIFTYEDLTERLALERSYNTLIEVQRTSLDHLQEGVSVFGSDGKLKLFNPVYTKLWNHDPEWLLTQPHVSELVERSKDLYVYNTDWNSFKEHVISFINLSQPREEIIERRDGKVIRRSASPLPDGGSMFSYVDITDSSLLERSLRERNEALEEADKVKAEFLANISYELRTPLTTIIGFSDMLLQGIHGSMAAKQHEYVEDIRFSSHYLLTLIDDILDLTSSDAGHLKLDMTHFDFYHTMQTVEPMFKDLTQRHHLTFHFDCPADIGFIEGDEGRITQVLVKLLHNAVFYNQLGGQVSLGAKTTHDHWIEFWVEDGGIGIAQDDIPHLFDRFFRSSHAKVSGVKGTGLGLSVAKNIIDMHGGTITITSTLGQGTSVTCRLPRQHQQREPIKHDA